MSESTPAPVWRLRLMMLTALAVLVLIVLWLRSRADITQVEQKRAAMRGALRTLLAAQDAYQVRTGRYAMDLDSLTEWTPPPALELTFHPVDVTAWGATVHDSTLLVAPNTCGLYVGRAVASPHRAVVDPGTPSCW